MWPIGLVSISNGQSISDDLSAEAGAVRDKTFLSHMYHSNGPCGKANRLLDCKLRHTQQKNPHVNDTVNFSFDRMLYDFRWSCGRGYRYWWCSIVYLDRHKRGLNTIIVERTCDHGMLYHRPSDNTPHRIGFVSMQLMRRAVKKRAADCGAVTLRRLTYVAIHLTMMIQFFFCIGQHICYWWQ